MIGSRQGVLEEPKPDTTRRVDDRFGISPDSGLDVPHEVVVAILATAFVLVAWVAGHLAPRSFRIIGLGVKQMRRERAAAKVACRIK